MFTEAANNLNQLFDYLTLLITHQIQTETGHSSPVPRPVLDVQANPELPLNNLILQYSLSEDEIIILLTSLAPHIYPNYYNKILLQCFPDGGDFREFGGCNAKNHQGILPTGETAQFIIARTDMEAKLNIREFFDGNSLLFSAGLLSLGTVPHGEPRLSGQLILDPEYVELLTTGIEVKPTLSPTFPAELINTNLEWEDLVLKEKTLNEIKEIETWLKYNETLMNDWGMAAKIKPGFRIMFYGSPGTGKTLTASLLGKFTGRDVYRIDLSMVVSKYIGETEKNLASLFNKAKNKDWILFFDEADAIFGKRTSVRDAHDKYANQEVSYLLQRIEAHPGLVILASNLKDNIDEAFTRRFNAIIEFPLPSKEERLLLWQNSLPNNAQLSPDISLEYISSKYDLTGANIINVIQFACLKQLEQESEILELDYIKQGIKKEYLKEGRSI
ncbi:MAG: ATP-binding protein [Crocinitomicaceae bacterium]|nr:ATP-binding protein [Crocinitomicaceae bacterium]